MCTRAHTDSLGFEFPPSLPRITEACDCGVHNWVLVLTPSLVGFARGGRGPILLAVLPCSALVLHRGCAPGYRGSHMQPLGITLGAGICTHRMARGMPSCSQGSFLYSSMLWGNTPGGIWGTMLCQGANWGFQHAKHALMLFEPRYRHL